MYDDFKFGDKVEWEIQHYYGDQEIETIEGIFLCRNVILKGSPREYAEIFVAVDAPNQRKMQIMGPAQPEKPLRFNTNHMNNKMNFRKKEQ